MSRTGRATVLLFAAFATVGLAVAAGWTVGLDEAVTAALVAHRTGLLTDVAENVTALGSDPVVTIVALLAAGYCVASGRPRHFLALLWIPLAFLLSMLVKLAVHRPRPTVALVTLPGTYGFPSGHAVAASALYLTLALLVAAAERRTRPRRLLIGAGVLIVLLVAWSRVYLGVHYFSDVVGGLLLGSAGAVAAQAVVRRADSRSGVQARSGP